jgi:hypothetical protein
MKKIMFYLSALILLSCQMKNSKFKNELLIQGFISDNYEDYRQVHDTLNDIIKYRVKMKVKSAKSLISKTGFQVDNLIIFNKDRTKLYTTVNSINPINAIGSSDLIQSLYGVKIEGKWYVFIGHQNLIAMRDDYKYNKYEPFTWEEISFMAHEQMFARYISVDKNGSLIIKYDQLNKDTGVRELTGKIPGEYSTPNDAFISLNEYYESQTIDSTEIAQIREDLEAGKNKLKDPIKRLTWWNKLWGAQEPIFETDEWKVYVKNKNQKNESL